MIDEVAVEPVRLFCRGGHREETVDYDVVRYADPDGGGSRWVGRPERADAPLLDARSEAAPSGG
jgi:hypothetical protein